MATTSSCRSVTESGKVGALAWLGVPVTNASASFSRPALHPSIYSLLPPLQHALRRKATAAGRWLRFLSQTGLWAKLTEAQGAALLEGCERVAACQVLCGGLISRTGDGAAGVSPALAELLRAHAMRRWGEDLPAEVRQRLEQGGLPPLDLFLANPSAVARKLASLQVGGVRRWCGWSDGMDRCVCVCLLIIAPLACRPACMRAGGAHGVHPADQCRGEGAGGGQRRPLQRHPPVRAVVCPTHSFPCACGPAN